MNGRDTIKHFLEVCGQFNLILSENEISRFLEYKDLLISWNKKINLTSITEDSEIMLKHFVDSLSLTPFIYDCVKAVDIGTGAGFPGLPLKIVKQDMELTLLDSLNKRIIFLAEVVDKLGLTGVEIVRGRAEAAGRGKEYREKFDVAFSRAVAPLNVLTEYCLPFVNIGGAFLAMKGGNAEQEIEEAQNAIALLGGEVSRVKSFNLGKDGYLRTIIEISKVRNTPEAYPRREGSPQKKPL